jgi:Ca-activated chloride channel family protein
MRLFLIALFALVASLALAGAPARAAPSLTTPPTAVAGSTIVLQVVGSGNPREFVTVVPKGAREGEYHGYEYVTGPGNLKLEMPATPGDYELRLCEADIPYKTMIAKPITLSAASASVSAPASVAAGAHFEVQWTGPGNDRDYITIGETTPGGRLYLNYEYAGRGSPLTLAAPDNPGNYEVRYILGVGDTVLARQPITVGGVTASVTVPAQVAAGARFKVSWTGPSNPGDYITMVQAGAAEKTWDRYEYTSKGKALELTAPDVPGDYEIRYATGQSYLTLARAPITARRRSPPVKASRPRGRARTTPATSSPSCPRARARANTARRTSTPPRTTIPATSSHRSCPATTSCVIPPRRSTSRWRALRSR